MTTYNGILIRANASDTGTIPRTGTFSACPDIIPWQQMPVTDPQGTFGAATGSTTSYDQDPGKDIIANDVNYIYVRGMNTGTAVVSGATTYLFYSPSNLILWPEQWMTDAYMITPDSYATSGAAGVSMNDTGAGAITVTPQPFVWRNPQPPAAGTHYCLITMCGTSDEIAAMQTDAGNISSSSDLGAWISRNGGTGWRNVVTTTTGAPTFSTLTNYSNNGPVATIHFTLVCTNIPAGSEVAFSCPVPNTGGADFLPIQLPWTTVPAPVGGKNGDTNPSFTVGLQTKVAANYASSFNYQYRSNGYAKPAGFSITMQALVQSNGTDALADHSMRLAHHVQADALYYHPVHGFGQGLNFTELPNDGNPFGPHHTGNLPVAVLGSHTTMLPGGW